MKVKRTLLILTLIFVPVLAGVLSVGTARYLTFFERQLIRSVEKSGVNLSLSGGEISGIGIRYKSINALFRHFMFNLALTDAKASINLFSLLKFSPNLSMRANIYGGVFEGNIGLSNFLGMGRNTINIHNINLFEHPQVAGFGVRKGVLSLSADNLLIKDGIISSGRIVGKIIDLNKPGHTTLPARLTGLPIDLKLPPFDISSLDLEGVVDEERWKINKISCESSLVSISGYGQGSMNRQSNQINGEITLDFVISSTGVETVSPYISLISNGLVKVGERRFQLIFNLDRVNKSGWIRRGAN